MNRRTLVLLSASLVALAGCDSFQNDGPASELEVQASTASPAPLGVTGALSSSVVASEVTLNGYAVEFIGAAPDGGGTRFDYDVTRVDPNGASSDWFFLESGCGTVIALQPSNAVKDHTLDDGTSGVQWNASLPSVGATRRYSYTFSGSHPVGFARAAVSRANSVETATVPGPCAGYRVSGTVFVNSDQNAAKSETERGVEDVLVQLYTGSGTEGTGTLVGTYVTDISGNYEFVLPSGSYTVRIPTNGESGNFNSTLYRSYLYSPVIPPTTPTTAAELSFSVNGDVSGKDFGFSPNKQQIIRDLTTDGEDGYRTRAQDVRFWQGAVRNASRGRNTTDPYTGVAITPTEVGKYLDAIFSVVGEPPSGYYLLQVPFALTGTDKFAAAADLLSKPTKTDVEKVSRNLFAMQLNRMRGWGTKDQTYDDALMSYLEDWVRAQNEATGINATSTSVSALRVGGGGGGTVEEQMTLAYLGGGGGGTVD